MIDPGWIVASFYAGLAVGIWWAAAIVWLGDRRNRKDHR